jgi:hypothetical protein
LGSIELPHDEVDERRVDARANRLHPQPRIGESAAFYRVLLRHQDRARLRKRDIVA